MKITYRKGKIYFDDEAWALILWSAKIEHQSPKTIVIKVIRQGIKNAEK